MKINLPVAPLQLSQCFVNVPGRGRVTSKQYRTWKLTVDEWLMSQRQRGGASVLIPGAVEIEIRIKRRDSRRRDLDNSLKCLLDALARNRVIDDDADVEALAIRYVDDLTSPVEIAVAAAG